jgi:hypothetical protein
VFCIRDGSLVASKELAAIGARRTCDLPGAGSAPLFVSCDMSADKTILNAVEETQDILAHYVEPGPRDCEKTINSLMDVLDDEELIEAVDEAKHGTEERMSEITEAQKAELKRLSKEARVPDMSETVTTSEEAEMRICDLKEKAQKE